MLAAHPILETLMSFARRLGIEKQGLHQPDHLHLHSLIHHRLSRVAGSRLADWQVNSMTTAPLLGVGGLVAVLAFVHRLDSAFLQALAWPLVAVYVISYCALRWLPGGPDDG